jgi:hypothetical protein
LAVARRIRGLEVELARHAVDRVLVDLRQRRRAEVLDDRIEESLTAAVLQVAQGCRGERNGSATTVDGFGKDFALTFCADFFRGFFVVNSSAFLKSDFRGACRG